MKIRKGKVDQGKADALKMLLNAGVSVKTASKTLGFSSYVGYLLKRFDFDYPNYIQHERDRMAGYRSKPVPDDSTTYTTETLGTNGNTEVVINQNLDIARIGALVADINTNISKLLEIELEKKNYRDAMYEKKKKFWEFSAK
jgi:hypothetical protein